MKTKIITLLFAIVASVGTIFAWDYYQVGIGDLYYNLDASINTAAVVSMPSGKYTGDITIPASVEYESVTYSVTSINHYVFSYCSGLTSVTIPNSVTSIGVGAFEYCSGLTSVTIPNSVTSIGVEAFYNCSSLTSVTIPNSVTSIGDYAFSGCSGLTTPVYNANCFAYMPTSYSGAYTIPDGIKQVADGAFNGCTSLTSVTFPNSVTEIRGFDNCTGLTSVTFSNSVTIISGFDNCSGLTSVSFPNSVTIISGFDNCSGLTSVSFPNSVTEIWGFDNGTGLTSVTFSNSVTKIRGFDNCTGLTSVTFPNSVTEIRGFDNCTGLTSVTFPNSVTEIWGFNECTSLTSVHFPSSLKEIYKGSFNNCTSLTNLSIPESVVSLEGCFWGCRAQSVVFPSTFLELADDSFASCVFGEIICKAQHPPYIGGGSLANVSRSIPVYVPLSSILEYQQAEIWNEFTNIKPIQAKEASVTEVVIEPSDDYVDFSWPKDAATTYTIEIKKNGELVCTLSFNDLGQLLNINFANLVHKIKHSNGQLRMVTQTATGWQYEINSLYPATRYTYSVIAHGSNDTEVYNKSGEFTTTKNGEVVTVYIITFVDKDEQTIAYQHVEQGSAAIPPAIEGYHVSSTDKPLTNIQADQTIKVLYEINTYNVRFVDWNDQELKSETVEYGKSATAPANPSREGYTFTGWDKEFTNIQSDLTVKAQYAIQTFVVKFVDWDDKELKSDTVDYGKSATAPADPSREGYTFKGWDKEFTNVQSDLVVKAVYEKNPDEAIDDVNAENVISQKVLQNGQLLILRNGEIYNAQGARMK